MAKKILIIYYTQSGQLSEIVESFSKPLIASGAIIDQVQIKPKNDFTFPWTAKVFFETMPESVLGIPQELKTFSFKETFYDLVVLAYQPWFLSPSIPATSLLLNSDFKNIIKGTPVVTLIGSRNMWLNAQEKVKNLLKEAGANLVGNITLVDRNNNHISAVTILYWMLSGKKDKYLGVFPKPGISDADISNVSSHGAIVAQHLISGDWNDLQDELVKADAVYVKPNLMFIENTGSKLFKIWANVIIKKKNRAGWSVAFKYYLLFALFIVAPMILVVNSILIRPFFMKKLNRKREYYLGVN
jgi:hypothetical protein